MRSVLEIKNVYVKYGNEAVLQNVSFTVEHGDYIGVVGPNGSGKTTMMKALLGLVPVSGGAVIFPDKNLKKENIGYVQQKQGGTDTNFPATVREIVSTGLIVHKKGIKYLTSQDKERVDEILGTLQIKDLQNKKVGHLSGGQYQRMLLARALVNRPGMLILDEPASALDPKIRDDLFLILSELNKNQGITILFVSHDIGSIGKYTNKMLYLDRKVVFFGDYEQFCQSKDMTEYFGYEAQHNFCWRHNHE
ncbi:MAG: ABC transporter ATP-binding protein [Spirochaetota bacterium]